MRRIAATALMFWLLSAGAALACSVNPVTLTNGTTADATQVMQNFNNLLNCLNAVVPGATGSTTLNSGLTIPSPTLTGTANGATIAAVFFETGGLSPPAGRPSTGANFINLSVGNPSAVWSGSSDAANAIGYSLSNWTGTQSASSTNSMWLEENVDTIAGPQTSTLFAHRVLQLFGGGTTGAQNRNGFEVETKLSQGDISASPTNGGGYAAIQSYTLDNYYSTANEGPHSLSGTSTNGSCTVTMPSTTDVFSGDSIAGPGIATAYINTVTTNVSVTIFPCAGAGAGAGTFTTNHYGGVFWATNFVVGGGPAGSHGDIYPGAYVGSEVDVGGDIGAHPEIRMGWNISSPNAASNANQLGILSDAGLLIGGYWRYGIAFSKAGVGWPFTASVGTIMGSGENYFNVDSPRKALCGVCFPDVTFTNFSLQMPGFTVDGSGNEVANSLLSPSLSGGTGGAAKLTLSGGTGTSSLNILTNNSDEVRLWAVNSHGDFAIGPPPAGTFFISDQACISCGGTIGSYLLTGPQGGASPAGFDMLLGDNSHDASLTSVHASAFFDISAASGKIAIGTGTGITGIHGTTVEIPDISNNTGAQTGTLCWAAGGITYDNTNTCLVSSRRFKDDIAPLSGALLEVMKFRPVSFRYKEENEERFGLIAEEVARVDPRLVADDAEGRPLKVRYLDMIGMLIGAVQDQERQIRRLQK